MRIGQHNNNNKNRNRNRNRRNSGGGGGGQSGGSGANRVYDSNGPDVKLRGTAQTIAEKYMQLARDAHSSGDSVAAEGYYQFADHYYRVWLAAQPVGQPIQFSRRNAEEEYDEDGNEQVAGAEGENAEGDGGEAAGGAVSAEGGEGQPEGEGQAQGYQNRGNNRNFRDNNNNREGGNNRNFKQRWPRRNDRYNQEGQGAVMLLKAKLRLESDRNVQNAKSVLNAPQKKPWWCNVMPNLQRAAIGRRLLS